MAEPLPQDGVAIQSMNDLKKLPPEVLIEKLIQANRLIQEERRLAIRKDVDAKAYIKTEFDRLRGATAQHIRDLELQNNTILKALTRLQGENDKFRAQITTLEVKLDAALHVSSVAVPDSVETPRIRIYPLTEPPYPGSPLSPPAAPPPLSGSQIPPRPSADHLHQPPQ